MTVAVTVATVTAAIEDIAPLDGAEAWDRVGLLIGSPAWPAQRVLLTIDLTAEVLAEAIDAKTGMIIAYHPPIFEPLRALTDRTEKERIALDAARAGVAVYSPHTALDAAPAGVNDWLAAAFGAGDVAPLVPLGVLPPSEACKLVTFCPRDVADALRRALGAAGAGAIGAYALCSFEIEGTGTFRGDDTTNPTIGARGRLERVDEIRLEMVCPRARLADAIAALRATHPYEEPPVEVYSLEPRPARTRGAGRISVLERRLALADVVTRLKKHLGVTRLDVAAGRDAPRRYGTIGVCAGAGASLLETAIARGCELFLTGEMRHHDVLAARAAGCTVVLAGHTNTERGYLRRLRTMLSRRLPDCTLMISRRDRDPLKAM